MPKGAMKARKQRRTEAVTKMREIIAREQGIPASLFDHREIYERLKGGKDWVYKSDSGGLRAVKDIVDGLDGRKKRKPSRASSADTSVLRTSRNGAQESLSLVFTARSSMETAAALIQGFSLYVLQKEAEDTKTAAVLAGIAAERTDYERQIADLREQLAAERLGEAERMLMATQSLRDVVATLRAERDQLEVRLRQRIQQSNHRALDAQKHFIDHADSGN